VIAKRNALELARHGYDVDVLCTEGMTPDQIPPECAGRVHFHVLDLPHRRGNITRYLFEYSTFLIWAIGRTTLLAAKHRYQAVLVDNLPDMLVFGAPLPRLRGARLVFNMLELTPEMLTARLSGRKGHVISRVARTVEALAIGAADEVIVVSKPCLDVLRGRNIPERKLSIVINTVDVPPDVSRVEGGPLVTHGTLVERYGTHLAIEAMDRLKERWPDLNLQVMGTGEDMPRLRALTEELRLGARVEFTGNLPWTDVQRRIARAAMGIVAVMPDHYGELLLPTKLLELSALAIPAVCARQPAIEAYFPEDSVTYFTPGSVDGLVAGITRLLLDPDLARRQGERAREVVSAVSWETQRRPFLHAVGIDPAGTEAPGPSLAARPGLARISGGAPPAESAADQDRALG
jgi:glycosyltransferase involved in cell wall biosynthesis